MHATYGFRASTDNIDEAVTAFELFAGEHFDENNWYELLCAVNSKGKQENLASSNSGYRKTADEFLKTVCGIESADTPEELANKIHGRATISDFKRFIWECVVYEVISTYAFVMHTGHTEPYQKFKSGIENLFAFKNTNIQEFPERFVKQTKELSAKLQKRLTKTRGDRYWSNKLKKMIYRIKKAENHKRPFVVNGTPYDFRAFDLDNYLFTEGKGETILLVDIHT